MKIKIQNLWDVMIRKKFVALNTFFKKEERYHINKLTFHLKMMKKEQTKLKQNEGKK